MSGWSVVHILGIILWAGGLMNLTRMLAYHVQQDENVQEKFSFIESRIFNFVTLPGAVLTILAGLFLLMHNAPFYMSQPWFHAKLTFVLLLIAATVFISVQLSKLKKKPGQVSQKKIHMMVHGFTGIFLVLILIMIYLRPWAVVSQ